MNRHDFEMLARAVKSMKFLGDHDRLNVSYALASDIESGRNNSGFHRDKFLKQCGVANAQ